MAKSKDENELFKQDKARKERMRKKMLSFNSKHYFRLKGKTATDKSPLTGYRENRGNLVIMLVFGTIGFLTIPNLLLLPSGGLDRSWQVGLNMARIYGLQFGKDIVFTFGPLGFIYLPIFCQFNTWLISAAFCLFVHILLIYSIVIMMKKLSARPADYVLMGITLMFALSVMSIITSMEYKLLFSILILLYLSTINQFKPSRLLILCVFVSFLMAVVSLIKFNAMVITAGILLFMIVFCLYKKQLRLLCCMLFTYTVSVLVLLVMMRQKITNFPAYLLNSYEVCQGYNSAMIVDGPFRDVCVGLCVVGLLLFLLLNSILKNKPFLKYFILINLSFVFVSFKYGFMRHDARVRFFCEFAFDSLFYVYSEQKTAYLTIALFISGAHLCFNHLYFSMVPLLDNSGCFRKT